MSEGALKPMKPTLAAGVMASHSYTITAANTVPHLAMDRSTFERPTSADVLNTHRTLFHDVYP